MRALLLSTTNFVNSIFASLNRQHVNIGCSCEIGFCFSNFSSSEGTSWTSGSWIEIQGQYNNTIFKGAMIAKTIERYPLSCIIICSLIVSVDTN